MKKTPESFSKISLLQSKVWLVPPATPDPKTAFCRILKDSSEFS